MTAPFALAAGLLVLSLVLAIGLIPVLDAELRRAEARRAAQPRAPRSPHRRVAVRTVKPMEGEP